MSRSVGGEGREKKEGRGVMWVRRRERERKESRALFPSRIDWGMDGRERGRSECEYDAVMSLKCQS
jgi:hypothetical protein